MKIIILSPTKEQCKQAFLKIKKQLTKPLVWSKNEGIVKKRKETKP
ncbi:hypothetical protein LCGC14_0359340 [marine sediment metagenome]|uniref:Uncharacterized protein n=1 Tax=marine sediment metagenome TaxID=412755 RepID=A0A0F9TE75_9ZZZZ